MTWTYTSDMINPELLSAYVQERVVAKSSFIRAGIVVPDAKLTSMILAGGFEGRMPFYQQLTGAAEVLEEDGTPLVVDNVETAAERYIVLARGKAFGASDLAKAFSGDDPMRAIGNMVGDYWTAQLNADTIAMIRGAFTAGNMAALVENITTNPIEADVVIDAKARLGDASQRLNTIMIHSATYAKLKKDQMIEYLRDVNFEGEIPFYLGMRVLVDDSLPTDGTDYVSYLLADGSFSYGGNGAPVAFETGRNQLGGIDFLISRSHHVIHPRGLSFTVDGTIGSTTPTNAEIIAGAEVTASRVFEIKNMGIVTILHRL